MSKARRDIGREVREETVVARERRVVAPDGYVWYLRRRRAGRRPPWARRPPGQGSRFHGEAELPAEESPRPSMDRPLEADAPRRVWRVQGWRRSGRFMDELAAAIAEGRIDNRRAVILRHEGR